MPVIELTKDTFEKTVTEHDIVLIDFWAAWCGPCKSFAPIYDKVAEKHPDIVFAKVNTEEERELAGYFQIRSIPTLALFREQILLMKQAGALPEAALEQVIAKAKELDMDEVRQDIEKQKTEKDAAPAQTPAG